MTMSILILSDKSAQTACPGGTLEVVVLDQGLDVEFRARLAALRKEKGFPQQSLAERVGMSLIQIHRCENAQAQPRVEAIRRLCVALGVPSEQPIFGKDEREPDEDLRLQFEPVSRFDAEDKQVVKAVLQSLTLEHEAKRWASAS